MFSTGMGGLLSTRVRRRLPPGVRHVVDASRGSGETQRGDRSDGQDLQRPAGHHRLAVYAAGENETQHQLSTNQRHFRKCSCKLSMMWPTGGFVWMANSLQLQTPCDVTCWWMCGWRRVYSCKLPVMWPAGGFVWMVNSLQLQSWLWSALFVKGGSGIVRTYNVYWSHPEKYCRVTPLGGCVFVFFLLKQCWCGLWRVSSHFLAIIIK